MRTPTPMNSDPSDFHVWLQEQQGQGTFSSEGSFSLKRERSWQKLGAFQLPFPEAWVLKLVQCAVALGAEEIRVAQTWRESRFSFVGGREISPEDVESAVFEMPEYLPRALLTLGTAVRALGKGSQHPFCLCYPGGVGQAWTGERFVNRKLSLKGEAQFSILVSHFEIGAGVSDIWSLSGDALREKMLRISGTLIEQCYAAPARVYLDGRQLNGLQNDPVFGLTTSVRPLALVEKRSDELPTFSFPISRAMKVCASSDLQIESGFAESLGKGEIVDQSVLLLMSAFLESEEHKPLAGRLRKREQWAELLWLVDGVISQREQLPWKGPVSFAVMVSGDGLETDLTGLALRQSEAYFQRRDTALREISDRILQRECSARFYSEHPLAKLYSWVEKWLGDRWGKRVPALAGRHAPAALEARSIELERAVEATLAYLQNSLAR